MVVSRAINFSGGSQRRVRSNRACYTGSSYGACRNFLLQGIRVCQGNDTLIVETPLQTIKLKRKWSPYLLR